MDDSRLNPLHTAPLPPLVNASRVLFPAIAIKSNHGQLQHSSLSNPATPSRGDTLHDSRVLKPCPLSYPSTTSSNPDPVIPSVGNQPVLLTTTITLYPRFPTFLLHLQYIVLAVCLSRFEVDVGADRCQAEGREEEFAVTAVQGKRRRILVSLERK